MGSIEDLFKEAVEKFEEGLQKPAGSEGPANQVSPPLSTESTTGSNPGALPGEPVVAALPDRQADFILPDVYPGDPTGANPPFHVLPGLVVDGKEVVGCYIKATEGTGWGSGNEAWFQRNWLALKPLTSASWFRGCYHFLRFAEDGTAQADYFCDQVQLAGGWGEWDLQPWCDIEAGGQGSFWNGADPNNLDKLPLVEREKFAALVTNCAEAFVARFKARTGLRIGIYGRGLFRDLSLTQCRFGADTACNPAYTTTMPPMTPYGWTEDEVVEWQACGDGECYLPGYPKSIPGWGATDWSVYINGNNPTRLSDLRARCLAKKPV